MDLAMITTIVATRINKPLTWWKQNLPSKVIEVFGKSWFWSLIAYAILSVSMLGITIFGVNNESIHDLLNI
jgi:hypothetical protein